MSIIIPGKLIYLCNARVASHATVKFLETLPGAITTDEHHGTLDECAEERTGEELVVSTVRNHFTAIASWWFVGGRSLPFAGWVKAMKFPGVVTDDSLFAVGRGVCDHYLKYENLEAELEFVFRKTELPFPRGVNLTQTNVTRGKVDHSLIFDAESVDAVIKRFGNEMVEYGYKTA
jgi:hypothetical protein